MTRDGYETYILYLALQKHFSSNYDFFKYNGKVKASTQSYQKRNDIYSFEKIPKIVPKKEILDFMLAHFLDNPKAWIKNMSRVDYEKYKSVLKNMTTNFKRDLETISHDPASFLAVTENEIPKIHDYCMRDEIKIESLVLLDQLHPFIDDHEEKCKVPFAFPQHITRIKKYRPFVIQKVDINIIRDIARDILLKP